MRQRDKPRYLALLFAPDDKRADLMALHAFNAEVSRVPLAVSEPQLGEVRLQWWRDTLESIEKGEGQAHPVAIALSEAIRKHRLPVQPLLDLVDAHSHDLYADQFSMVSELEEYLGNTSSVLIQLSAMVLDPVSAPQAAKTAGLAGVAYGIGQIVCNPKRYGNLVPAGETLETLAARAKKRLSEASRKTLPDALRPAFHHIVLTELFLSNPGRTPSQWRMQWRLWRASRNNFF